MEQIPRHRAWALLDMGVALKETGSQEQPVGYMHRDDYFLFGIVEEGECTLAVDFREHRCIAGHAIAVVPGQAHAFLRASALKGYVLFADGTDMPVCMRSMWERYGRHTRPVPLTRETMEELSVLRTLLSGHIRQAGGEWTKSIVRNLAAAMAAILAEAFSLAAGMPPKQDRFSNLFASFSSLLKGHLHVSRSPAHYASLLHVSPSYLNEAVRNVTGTSVSRYIQEEWVLEAKRRLAHTSDTVRQVASGMGMDDSAYFTRLFTRIAGESPSAFRRKHLGLSWENRDPSIGTAR